MIKPIVQDGHPALREIADPIKLEKILSEEIQEIIKDMQNSLATQKDGVALAAPQLGISKQIFIIAPFIFEEPEKEHLVYINPEIINRSVKAKWRDEGCLSCRWKVGEVKRDAEITIIAYDENGNKFEESGDSLLAHIFQHETDHLVGILFTDKARKLRDMTELEISDIENN